MATSSISKNLTYAIEEAKPSDLDSLSTIIARAFHPVNSYIKTTLPDTPAMRDWLKAVFKASIEDPKAHVLIAVDTASASEPRNVLGVLALRLMEVDEPGPGLWGSIPLTSDHHKEKYESIIGALAARERLMRTGQPGARPHFMIELFGVDHDVKGRGLGGKLIRRAAEIADEAGYETFVQANASAMPVYCKVGGFEMREREALEGGYEECMLVRPAKGTVVSTISQTQLD